MLPTMHLKAEPIYDYAIGDTLQVVVTGYRTLQWWSERGKGPEWDELINGEWRYLDGCEP